MSINTGFQTISKLFFFLHSKILNICGKIFVFKQVWLQTRLQTLYQDCLCERVCVHNTVM